MKRFLAAAYAAVFIFSLLWTILARPEGHLLCTLCHALLAILGGNLVLLRLRGVLPLELKGRDVLIPVLLIGGVFVNLVLHALLH